MLAMTEASSNEFLKRNDVLEGQPVCVTSYKVGVRYCARVDNIDPGAIIGRGQGASRLEAETAAIDSAALTLQLRNASSAMRRSVDQLPIKRGPK
jgi:hypothetical protein